MGWRIFLGELFGTFWLSDFLSDETTIYVFQLLFIWEDLCTFVCLKHLPHASDKIRRSDKII